jgi:hypothetical protein
VEKHIQPGITRLNWNSLNINSYAVKCSKLLKNLSSIVTQIIQIRRDLDDQISNTLTPYNLFTTEEDPNEPGYELKSCKVRTKYLFETFKLRNFYYSVNKLLFSSRDLCLLIIINILTYIIKKMKHVKNL